MNILLLKMRLFILFKNYMLIKAAYQKLDFFFFI